MNGEASFYNTLEIENDNDRMKASGKITISDKGEKEMHLLDFCIVPINRKHYSDSVAIVPVIGYTIA